MKLLGMFLICTASLAAACGIGKTRGERIRSLRAFCRMLELMEGELTTKLSPLPDLVMALENKSSGTAKVFLEALGSRLVALGQNSFAQLWTDSLRQSADLEKEDLETLRHLGGILGQYELERQVEAIRQCRERLRQSAERLALDHRQKNRTACGVALLSAAMLCIVLL